MFNRFFKFDNNKILAKKLSNLHFYNNQKNKLQYSQKLETINNFFDDIISKNEKNLNANLEGFLTNNNNQKQNPQKIIYQEEIETRMSKIVDKVLSSNCNILLKIFKKLFFIKVF